MCKNNVKASTITYNSLIDACVRNGQMTKAWSLLKKMQNSSFAKPDNFTYSTLIKGIKGEEHIEDLD